MKKFFYLLPVLALVFSACSDDDDENPLKDNKVTVKASEISIPAGEIDAVKLITYSYSGTHALATAKWDAQEGFTLQFPETVSSSYLIDIEDAYDYFDDDDDIQGSINISDKNAKICSAIMVGFDGDDEKNDIFLGKITSNEIYGVGYIYSDRDVKVTGTVIEKGSTWTDTYKFDLHLKKGWNNVLEYNKEDGNDDTWEYRTSFSTSGLSWIYGYMEIR
ncbi:MAG: hypothetical protein LIO77_04970 [Rikenellaceae bacterium]|nr:hypothetical protein [Rikenellaceae bacterium]